METTDIFCLGVKLVDILTYIPRYKWNENQLRQSRLKSTNNHDAVTHEKIGSNTSW